MMLIQKRIAFATPGSYIAENAGMAKTGGWYIQQTLFMNGFADATRPIAGYKCYLTDDDPELQKEFTKTKGSICPLALAQNPKRYPTVTQG